MAFHVTESALALVQVRDALLSSDYKTAWYKRRMSARSQLLDAVPSVLWTAVSLGPVFLFCAHNLPLGRTICFLVGASVSTLLPKAALERFALSTSRTAYERLGVPSLTKFTQDAGWLRRMGGSSKPRARRDKESLRRIVRDTWMRERFHLGVFVFLFLCSAAAALQRKGIWLFALILINVFYNVYPILLQQYLRLRVTRCQGRSAG